MADNDNPYLGTVTQLFGDDGDSDLRQSLIEGMKTNPDTAAKALPYAQQKKIPLDMAERNLPALEEEQRFNDIDFQRIQRESPMLGDFLRDRENARLAHDDINFLTAVGSTVGRGFMVGAEGVPDMTAATYDAAKYATGLTDLSSQPVGTPDPEAGGREKSFGGYVDAYQKGEGVVGTVGNLAVQGLEDVGQAVASSAPSIALGAAGAYAGAQVSANPYVAAAGGVGGAYVGSSSQTIGEFYRELEAEAAKYNADPSNVNKITYQALGQTSIKWGAMLAAPDALIPGKAGTRVANATVRSSIKQQAIDSLKQAAEASALKTVAKEVGKDMAVEGVTEGIQQAGQIVGVNTTVDKDIATRENALQVFEATLSGTVGGGGISLSSQGVAGTIDITRNVMQAQNNRQYLADVKTMVADPNGKLMGRSKEKMRDYLNRITGNQDLYVDGEAVNTFYQSLTPEDQQALNVALPGFSKNLTSAMESKGDMAINRADYFTYVQPLDTTAWLDENTRMMPEHFSAADISEYDSFMQDIYDIATEAPTGLEEGEIVQSNFYNQLLQKFGDRTQPSGKNDVAKMLSENPRAFYETILERSGNDPRVQEIMDRLVRDVQIVRPAAASLGDTLRRGDFDLLIDKARNTITGKGKRASTAKPDLLGNTKTRAKSAVPSGPKPVMEALIGIGRVKTGSAAAKRLAEYDITPKRYPKLFSKGGAIADLGAVPFSELDSALAGVTSPAPSQTGTDMEVNYADSEWIANTLRDEDFGQGALNEEQQADVQQEAYMDDLIASIGQSGVDIESASNAEIKVALERMLDEQRAADAGGGQTFDNSLPVDPTLTEEEQATLDELEAESENPPAFEPEQTPAPIEEQMAAELPVAERPVEGETIEDFGEKIMGAKKDMWQSYRESLSNTLPEDAKDITLSKHFPEPDYENLIAQGVDPKILAAIKAMRDEIPSKPQKSWRLKKWGQDVKQLRDFSLDLLEGGKTFEKFMEQGRRLSALDTFFNRIEMYAELGYPLFLKAKGWDLRKSQYSMYRGETFSPAKTMWAAGFKGSFGEAFDTREQAMAYLRAKLDIEPSTKTRQTKLDMYQITKTGEIVIGKKVGTGKFIDLKGGFTSVKEARAYLKENEKPLLVLLEQKKTVPPERRSTNDPRRGDDYRMGENVSPEKFAKEFGFRGVQFGNYVEQAKRARDLNNAYDALLDMANILDIPSTAISLNGSLGLAFGARGSGGKGAPAAHYEPDHVVINLTKVGGAGSLGHEWWHAMDNYFGKKQDGNTFLTANPTSRKGATAIRPEVVDAFKSVMDAIKKTDLKKRSKVLDKTRSKDYWSTDIEMSARAFEAYVVHKAALKGESNDYLANIAGKAAWEAMLAGDDTGDSYPYPTEQEMTDVIAPAFDALFGTLETRQTDTGTELYQGGPDDARGSIRFTPTGNAVITLFEKENLSTVMHELGHLYWRAMTEIAVLDSAPEQIKKDVDTMRAWVGAKPLSEAQEPLTVAQEEKIADGFLAYLREGKAPSVELQTAFSRFKGWMMRLYRGVRDTLPGINKDVRDVFDRMLATDDAIEALAREPIFKIDQAISNLLTKSEAERMTKKMDRAVEDAKTRLYKKALKQAEQRNTQVYREARGKLIEEVTAAVNDDRMYRAMDAAKEAGGFSRSALIKGWGKEVIPYLSGHGGLVAKKGGADPAVIAGLLGYTNSREMIESMMNAPKKKDRIDQLVEDEMLARYGDMLNDGSIEAEAMEQMHNELRGEVLAMEMDILSDLAKIPAPTKEGIRAKAIQIMSETKVKDIIPTRRLRAEKRAYYDYGKALGRKDYIAATRAKAQQLLNHHLYQMSVQAQRDMDKKMTAWRRLLNKSDEKIGRNRAVTTRADGTQTAGPDLDYVYAARAVLSKYGIGRFNFDFETFFANLRRDDPDSADTLLQAYSMLTDGAPDWESRAPNVRGQVMRTAPYKNLPWSDFQALSDAVDNLIEVGRNQKFIEINGQKVAKQQALDELQAQTATHKEANMPGVSDKWTAADKARRTLWGYSAVTTRVERFVKDMDRGYNGIFRKYLWQPLQDAASAYRDNRQATMKEVVGLLEPHKERLHGEPIAAPELVSSIDGGAYTFEDKAELIGMLMHTGNGYAPGSNGYKLLVGMGWAEWDTETDTLDTSKFDSFIQRLFREGTLTKEDMDLVQSLWDMAESMKPSVWKAHKKMYGFYPDSVTSVPVMTPVGQFKGGYWPAIVDKTKSRDAQSRENKRIAENENNVTAFPTTGRGATKSRVDAYAAPLEMSLRLLPSHIDWALRFVHIEPAVKDAAKLLLDKDFSGQLERVSPGAVDELMMPWLQRVARQSSDMPAQHRFWKDANSVASWGRRTTGVIMMAGNTVNIAMQFTGFTPLAMKTGYRNFGRAWLQWVKNPNAMSRTVNETSAVMRNAQASFIDQDFNRRVRKLIDGQTFMGKVDDMSQDYGYIGQKLVQNMINNIGWTAAYNQAYAGKVKDIEADNDLQAIRYADTIISETQGFNNPENVANIEAQAALGKLFLVFYSFFNNQGNFLMSEAKMIANKDAPVAAKAASAFHLYMMAYMIPSFLADVIGSGLRGNLPDDEDDDGTALDEWFQFFLISQFKYVAATVPYVGQAMNYVVSKFTPQKYDDQISVSPVFSTVEKIISAPFSVKRAMFNDGDVSKAVGDTLTAVGAVPGLAAPAGFVMRPAKWAADVAEGDSSVDGVGDVIQGLSSGRSGGE